MNRIAALALVVCVATPTLAATNVGVSIGNFPRPAVVYSQPVIIAPRPMVVQPQPVYLYVPPGHQKNWAKHCGHYGACGQQVYFVQESWVRERYNEQQRHGHGDDHGKKQKQHKD